MIVDDTGEWSVEVDVAVVGAGGCGLAAALAAADLGATVLVLEKTAVPLPNTTRSTGMIPAAGTRWQRAAGIDDSPETFAADMRRKTHGQGDERLARRLSEVSADLLVWLVDDLGVQLDIVTGFTYPGHSRERMHSPADRSGASLMRDLGRAAAAREHVDVVTGAAVTGLVVTPARDRVVGVLVDHGGATQRVRAGAVVLAANGFAADEGLVRERCPAIAGALYLGGEGSTGEAISWAVELGAATRFLDAYQGHATVAVPHNVLVSYSTVMEGGILVNRDGRRFGDETAGYSEYATAVVAQPGGTAVLLFDERVHELALAFDDYRTAVEAGAVRSAQEPSELADRFGIDQAGLAATLSAYAAAARGEAADEHGRQDCRELVGPWRGVRVTGALFHTQGGVVVDEHARVLRDDGEPVVGLYAGGGTAEGLSGPGAGGYMSGNGLLSALGLGWLAGRHAAGAPVPPT
ncbi:MAG: FAD-dependent oxidoreductase [Candidatus Nanopelagicales bacterium]